MPVTDWDDPVELAQSLVSYLDSSGGELNAIYDALDAIEQMDEPPEYFHIEETREHITACDEALDTAWGLLEEGDDPLMSPGNIVKDADGGEYDYHFADSADARSRLQDIEDALDDAVSEFSHAQDIVEAAGEVRADAIDADLGVYDTLADYMNYVHSQLHGMQEMAYEAQQGA